MKYYIVMQQDSVLIMTLQNGRWQLDIRLEGLPVNCIATDPHAPERVYCGTFGKGLWRSSGAGETWEPVGEGITYPEIMSVAVSQTCLCRSASLSPLSKAESCAAWTTGFPGKIANRARSSMGAA